MFERGIIDNVNRPPKNGTAVKIVMNDGRELAGRLMMSGSKRIDEELNGDGNFIDFSFADGERQLISKAAILSVTAVELPRCDQLDLRNVDAMKPNPYRILGITPNAGRDEIRTAYHRLAKQYHPDRYSNVELPDEVREYFSAVTRRINGAYTLLQNTAA